MLVFKTIPNGNKGKIITEGNTAAAFGAIYGGASVICWYPITPSSSLAEAMEYYLPRLRKPKDGKRTYAIVQAEDEIASAGMVVGAGWAGARSMTSTSGPGVSLMNETDRLGLLCRDSLRVFYYPTRRPLDRPADTDTAGGHLSDVRRFPWRHPAYHLNSS